MDEIKIKPIANYHGQFLMVSGFFLLVVTLVIGINYWQQYSLVIVSLILISLVTFFIGLVKKLEPIYSLVLTPKGILYRHKYGSWQLEWLQIQRIGDIKVLSGFEHHQLPYVAIKIKTIEPLISSISPRLASRLIHEQRPLTVMAIRQKLLAFDQGLINFTPFKFNNTEIKGPIAAFLHHSESLHKAYGYHLYLPTSAFDRDLADSLTLIKQCYQHSINYPADNINEL